MAFTGDFARYDFSTQANVWERNRYIHVADAQPHAPTMTVRIEVYTSAGDVQPPWRTPPIVQEYFQAPYDTEGSSAIEQAEEWMKSCPRFANLVAG